jgi:disulfide bond formation protein DsbB
MTSHAVPRRSDPRRLALGRLAPLLVLLAAVAVVGTALLSQHVGGLQPCELCLYERYAYYATIPLMLLALALGPRSPAVAWLVGLAGLLLLANAGLALYHVGVEQHWVEGPTACTGAAGAAADSIEALKAQLLKAQPIRCDEVQFSLLGISMAGWDAVASLLIAVFALSSLRFLGAAGRRA